MRLRKWVCLGAGFLLAVMASPHGAHGAGRRAAPKPPPGKLVFETTFHDFGKVTEGEIIHYTFGFKNGGKGPVKVVKTKSSCGCTAANTAFRDYAPGESGTLEVTIDTRGKHGIMVKTVEVFLENAAEEKIELTLSAELVPPPHPVVENKMLVTTDPKCRSCHLDSGAGMKGAWLYHRICVQCHGSKGVGASARALNDLQWLESVDDGYLRDATVHGLPEAYMPAFVDGVSPPLTEEQVQSLIEYIRSWGKQ